MSHKRRSGKLLISLRWNVKQKDTFRISCSQALSVLKQDTSISCCRNCSTSWTMLLTDMALFDILSTNTKRERKLYFMEGPNMVPGLCVVLNTLWKEDVTPLVYVAQLNNHHLRETRTWMLLTTIRPNRRTSHDTIRDVHDDVFVEVKIWLYARVSIVLLQINDS